MSADSAQEMWQGISPVALCLALDGGLPRQPTQVRCVWDEHEWRVLFEVSDTEVWATFTERGALLYQEEVVEVFVDPIGDLAAYFEIEINPLNTLFEAVLRRNRSGYAQDFSWRCPGLRSAVRRTSTGWNAELAFPFRDLAATPPTAGVLWRANFCRIDRPPATERELTAWSPPGRRTFHTPERFGEIQFTAKRAAF